jgi:signal transduction histidine kinase
MKNKINPIRNIFISRMIYSAFMQFVILGLALILVSKHLNYNQENSISSNLIINDYFTIEEIGKYDLLDNKYALNLELHNLADDRKLDSIKFSKSTDNIRQYGSCIKLNKKGFEICKTKEGIFTGITPIKLDNKILGFIITTKKYNQIFSVPISYGLLLIFLIVIGMLFFNFLILFLSMEKKINRNTQSLLGFISHKTDTRIALPELDIEEYTKIAQKFFEERAEIAKLQKEKAYYTAIKNISEQVAHDIRSPLAAINTAVSNVSAIQEDRRIMIKNASRRINDIANNLLSRYKNNAIEIDPEQRTEPELIFVILDSITSEKRFEYDENQIHLLLNINYDAYSCFSKINLISFKRILSNLINNSVEAVSLTGQVTISLKCDDNYINITIEDNGCGIPAEIIPQVTENGFSYQKPKGAGFGLSYAKQYIEKLQGKLIIDSEIKKGTKVTIKLLRCDAPQWFCETVIVPAGSVIFILDDDPSIHETWRIKFGDIDGLKLVNYSEASCVTQESINKINAGLYLIDYELIGNLTTGLDIIETFCLKDKSTLVTSCFEDTEVRARCEKLGIKMIPKSYVPYIPVKIQRKLEESCLVFIDNDEMMRMAWSFVAEDFGKNISTYSSPEEFNKYLTSYNKTTMIYLDSELANGVKGELYAKELYEKGFTEIYLSTGYPKEKFGVMPWIKSVVGKEPPVWLQSSPIKNKKNTMPLKVVTNACNNSSIS